MCENVHIMFFHVFFQILCMIVHTCCTFYIFTQSRSSTQNAHLCTNMHFHCFLSFFMVFEILGSGRFQKSHMDPCTLMGHTKIEVLKILKNNPNPLLSTIINTNFGHVRKTCLYGFYGFYGFGVGYPPLGINSGENANGT